SLQNMQDRKLAFLNAAIDRKTVSPERLTKPAFRYVVQAGSRVPARLVHGPIDAKTTSPERLTNPASRYVVQAGSVIPAALITGLRSDLPGQVTAQVTENVYDSPTGKYLVIPQGSKLVGTYDSQVAFGQDRVLLA